MKRKKHRSADRRSLVLSQPVKSQHKADIVIHFDGSCDPNPGGHRSYGWGVVVKDAKTGIVIETLRGIPEDHWPRTNNVAELCGLIGAIRAAAIHGRELSIMVCGDSQLAVALARSSRASSPTPHIQDLHRLVIAELKHVYSSIEFVWVRRSENKLADAAADTSSGQRAAAKLAEAGANLARDKWRFRKVMIDLWSMPVEIRDELVFEIKNLICAETVEIRDEAIDFLSRCIYETGE